jgi:hypothetical protein
MSYEVRVSTALPRALAAVRWTGRTAEIPAVIRDELGKVWSFLGEHTIRSTGHNVALYTPAEGNARPGPDMVVEAWFGVEVHETIPASEQILEIATPTGPVVSTVHWGEYSGLGAAYDALRAWCREHDQRVTCMSWEVYGDWFDDWAKVRTDVFFQVEPPHL